MRDSEGETKDRGATDAGRLDLWTAIILTSAGLLSAWASFQGGIWGGLEAAHYHRANAALTRSSELSIAAGQREVEHSGLLVAWLSAVAEEQPARARYLERQFAPPFDREFRRWRASLPADLRAAAADSGRPRFVGLLSGPADAARRDARNEGAAAKRAGATADRYARWTVVLASALFLAGMAAVVRGTLGRRIMTGLAALLTLVSFGALVLLPVSLGA